MPAWDVIPGATEPAPSGLAGQPGAQRQYRRGNHGSDHHNRRRLGWVGAARRNGLPAADHLVQAVAAEVESRRLPVFRLVAVAVLLMLALLLAGCKYLPLREDVVAQAGQEGDIAFNVVKIDEAVIEVLAARPRPAFHQHLKEHLPSPDLPIAVSDTVTIVIWEASADGLFGNSLAVIPPRPGATDPARGAFGIDAGAGRMVRPAGQTGRPGTTIPSQPVGPDGMITVPYAGRIVATGQTATELGRRIEALLAPIAVDPQALILVERGPGSTVTVAGEAIQGGRIPLSPGGTRLLDVIATAGGASTPVHETFVRLARDGVTATVPLAILVADPDQNILARPGDVLVVSRMPKTVNVFGAAGRNASISFASERLSLTEALAEAGGLLDQRADPGAIFVMRYEPEELVRRLGQPVAARPLSGQSPIVYRLDLADAKSYLFAKQFAVQDKDIIFVAEAKTVPITRALQALALITGPVTNAMVICRAAGC